MEPPTPQSPEGVRNPMSHQIEIHPPVVDDSSASWDWNDLFDFNVDDQLNITFDSTEEPVMPPQVPVENPVQDRVRKRDPRLTCSNFLAGRVPCACPEIDAMLLEEEEEKGRAGKKRARVTRAGPNLARCQVPECETDISELKGYHRRHRVCLRCANATCVLLDGQSKRYCQQCGKFHVLLDFDEGKRSCRRKLERHNNRRRRKPFESRCDEQLHGEIQTDDVECDGEPVKDASCVNSQATEREAFFESEDGHMSCLHSTPNLEHKNSESGVSTVVSGEAQMDGGKDDCKFTRSPSYYDTKSAYSSMCPTGRISFKLYDWNPAEFPRRLRHQIFQWLANMPVELEGYIRPGCTILTVFVAMPKYMWVKLFEDPVSYVRDFVAPGMMLCGKGFIIVYLNNMVFRVMKGLDGTSVMEVNVKVRAPRLHHVHPTCFEAGKPIEFVACGSNLFQSKFRFLVSFAGNYLQNEYSVASPHVQSEGETPFHFGHELCKIHIPLTEPNHFGPAFIEVENESGLSNFIPVLIGDKETCIELKTIQQGFDESFFSKGSHCPSGVSVCDACEVSAKRQRAFSEILLDIAWLLKEPASEYLQQSTSQIQRVNRLLDFLICNESTIILAKVLQNLKIPVDYKKISGSFNDAIGADMMLLQKHMDYARDLCQKNCESDSLVLQSEQAVTKLDCISGSRFQSDLVSIVPITDQDLELRPTCKLGVTTGSSSTKKNEETLPFLTSDIMSMKPRKRWLSRSSSGVFPSPVFGSRSAIFIIATAAVCLGVCAVIFHPEKVTRFAVSVRRCLFKNV
ncbi:putative Squamosa promoter binding protein-like 7 [Tripterygium wilfordii]|uniref:Putative Squamosa promoter binding protein-like 7 n=2 Tax=Tripterygium wilfordii TaxID=458696 RepID=A0A7J7CX28_TRIWF|nr:putative Squamosa promoter binding protein-like 7 [Tripterygium wilfordii]